MKEFYKDLHLTYLKGKTSNLKLFKWEVSEKSWIFHEVKEKLLTSDLFQEANHASCWFTNSWITLASPENSPIIIFGPYQVSCLNPLPPSLFVRQDARAKDHHNSFFLRLMIVFYDCHWRGLRKTGASYFFDGNEFWILLCFRGKHTENFNLVIHLAFLSMYHHPIFKRYILSNYPEFYRITLFLET